MLWLDIHVMGRYTEYMWYAWYRYVHMVQANIQSTCRNTENIWIHKVQVVQVNMQSIVGIKGIGSIHGTENGFVLRVYGHITTEYSGYKGYR